MARSKAIAKQAAKSGESVRTAAGDSLINFVNAFNTERDPAAQYQFAMRFVDRSELNDAYRGSWLAKKIVDVPAKDSTAKWRRWQADKVDIELIEATEKKYDVQRKLRRGIIRARLFGGAGLVIGVNGTGDPKEPLDLSRVKKGSLQYVHVMNKYELTAGRRITDPRSEWFGQPESYQVANSVDVVTGQSIDAGLIHPSRVVQLLGDELPDAYGAQGVDAWLADSVLQACDDAVRSAGIVTGGLSALIGDMKFDMVTVPGLTAKMSDKGYRARLLDRFAVANVAKSICNMLLLDGEETWSRIQTTFTGLPDVVRVFMEQCGGASGIPVSRLIGPGQVGLGGQASGETDILNYYDNVTTDQETVIGPAMTNLDEVILRSSTGTDDSEIYYIWNPLREMTEKQEAEMAQLKAKTMETISGLAMINEDALRDSYVNTLIEDETFSGFAQAIDEYGSEPEEPEQPVLGTTALREMARSGVTPPAIPGAPKQLAAPKVPAKVPAKDAAARTLYVRRDVLNGDDIKAWAEEQGFPTTVPSEEMHVTIIYSRTPVDWMKTGSDWGNSGSGDKPGQLTINPGGARLLEKMGKAVALLFTSSQLSWRNEDFKRAGATSDYQDYQPHISLTFDPGEFDWREAEPYRGKIVLGPEIFEECKDGESWRDTFTEDADYTATRGTRLRMVLRKPKRKRRAK